MKLNKEIKDRIDNYFANISAEELYDISVNLYGFKEDTSVEVSGKTTVVFKVEEYLSVSDESYDNNDDFNNFPFAA